MAQQAPTIFLTFESYLIKIQCFCCNLAYESKK